MALDLSDGNWISKKKFKEEFDLGETAYQTRMKAMTAGDSEFKNGYAMLLIMRHVMLW